MGKVKILDIILTDGKTEYYPGDVVSGKCLLELQGRIKVKWLLMHMRGRAKVFWTETSGTGESAQTESYSERVEYLSMARVLFGNGSELSALNVGKWKFDFDFILPRVNICTSFEGTCGSIRYWLKAELKKPWSFDIKVKRPFTVVYPNDLNRVELQMPIESNNEKTLCCGMCRSRPISMTVRTDKQGYYPGESIAIQAEFTNHTSRTIIPYAKLKQKQTFFAGGNTRVHQFKFGIFKGVPIKAHETVNWIREVLVPPLVPPSISNCFIIKVEYYVKIVLRIPGAFSLSVHLPIVVGTRPDRLPSSLPLDLHSSTPYNLAASNIPLSEENSFGGFASMPPPPPYFENPSFVLNDRSVHPTVPPPYVEYHNISADTGNVDGGWTNMGYI